MSARHTPGPWLIEFDESGGGFSIYVHEFERGKDRHGAPIQVRTVAVLASRYSWNHRAKESDANGKLMRAAPEMYAALHYFAKVQDCHCNQIEFDPDPCPHRAARAAIALAEGRAPESP